MQVLCQTVHWPKFSFISRTTSIFILSPQVWTTDKNSLVATDTLLYLKLLIVDRTCTVSAFQLDHLSLHSKLYICPGDTAQFYYHCATWLPKVGNLCNFDDSEWNQGWSTQVSPKSPRTSHTLDNLTSIVLGSSLTAAYSCTPFL
jgi:hypothetical protein